MITLSRASGPCEPMRPPNQGWGFPPGPMHHRNPVPSRPPCDGSIPVAARGLFHLIHFNLFSVSTWSLSFVFFISSFL